MGIQYEERYPAKAGRILEIFTDEQFLADYARQLQVSSHAAEVARNGDSVSITLSLTAPTDDLAPIFRKFVGHEVPIVDERTWTPDGSGGYAATLAVRASALGRTATIRGQLALTPDGGGSRFTGRAEADISLGLISGPARKGVESLARESLEDQTRVLRRWLAA